MDKNKKQEFIARIVEANRSELIVIMYDMMFVYMDDAKGAFEQGDWEKVKLNLTYIENVLRRLERDLNHEYKVASELFALYHFCLREISKCKYRKSVEELDGIKTVLQNLYVGMKGMAKEDHSQPLMRNSQKVVAGLTYGKSSVNEIYMDDAKRGFYV